MENQKPVKKIRIGTVCATVWENTSKDGKTFPNIHLERSYKDDAGEWKNTTSLRQSDLPAASLALSEVYRYLALTRQEA